MKVMFLTGSCWMRDDWGKLKPFIKDPNFIKVFTMFGDQIMYPPIYWYEGNYMFPYLEQIIEKDRPDLIVGYSAGGHPGFHLCNKYKIRGLHFNPAIARTSEAPTLQILPEDYKTLPLFGEQVMVIGEQDRLDKGGVDAHLVVKSLEEKGFEGAGGEILIIPGLGHGVPIQLFEMAFAYYREMWWGPKEIVNKPVYEVYEYEDVEI